jgi:Tfp pilus assembly protein PilO
MKKISPKMLALAVLGAVAVIALIGWFGLVSPQRSKAHKVDDQIADAKSQLRVARMLATAHPSGSGKKKTGLAQVRIAMPDDVQMPSVLNEVQKLARSSKVSLDTFTPSAATVLSGYNAVPIQLSVAGRYNTVEKFLRSLRQQAGSRGGHLWATGRLYDVQNVSLSPGADDESDLTASIQLAVFTYTGQLPTSVTDTTITDTTTTSGGA